jgi:hypothetical protein
MQNNSIEMKMLIYYYNHQLLFLSLYLNAQEWNDMNLRWNTSEYGGVKDLRIPPHRIWKPDVLMYNRFVYDFEL